ncbi:GapA-binding peptide SR1P [Paenibacillus apiarius]|uniref:GapA-binding peptide SR1P n=1 Tax=Paenibacillus apiarius TaxID=46240 RepID=A0ABT4DYQ1_9BACL|nr:GapA-binding peptide SR1P [Paenibacillus apiarius]MBN3525558.1 GapA-binding peptide SR1P [Paenibacillus apiarius]MCY9512593.1 GapA-binding peptide SR1P [Paenibacillus apiarius]MCY9522350.1 GapA-binding peptide SR1P [Paenibacillus apiarius]MCY9553686.1 GapA-binding peptide SR1P [Paenibacillus apiarius]MCY9556629.1 GapA-binding peptide SR1P [Paenibacillus apiarius]
MEHGQHQMLGIILCKRCERIIAEQDTERVMMYYVECGSHDCQEQTSAEREVQHLEF